MGVKSADEVRRNHGSMERAPATSVAVTLDDRVIETHMSWVFLGTDSVLKLKKPVRTEFLDFSTLAAREFNCREEVRLNRRLSRRS